MTSSGAAWDARYQYFTKGWVNNWGFGAYDGSWGTSFLNDCSTRGYIPGIEYYQVFGEPGGGESATYAKLQNASTMNSYFSDFKILMQRVKDFNKPTLILLEADAFGFLEQQTAGNPNAYAAVAASGMPELAGLPDTVAGWGLAFLQLRASVGATNAILGIHVSGWAGGKDIVYGNAADPLQPEVDTVYNFLAPFGLTANATGQQYDVLVGDPLDRDADYYRLVLGAGDARWWDASDTAGINTKSFNRYAEFLRLWNVKAQKRWVLWQIPIGNSNNKNVYNNGAASEGYKDNRAEYWFANGTTHLEKFADVGVIALLFGAGAGGQAGYANDQYTDGKLFLQSRAGAILAAGGVPVATGSGSGAPTCTPVTGIGTGLTGAYFANATLTGTPQNRTDATVNFTWGTGAPLAGIPADNFSVRWTGTITPRYSGATTFYTQSDDGIRLWVNGQLLVDNWTNHGPTENSGVITLTAGQSYDVKLEYFEATGGAVAQLSWSSTCETKQVVPMSQLSPTTVGDTSVYNFETTAQGWQTTGAVFTAAQSPTRAFSGAGALKLTFSGTAGTQAVTVSNPVIPAGTTVTFHVYVPSGSQITAIQPYVLQGAAGGWAWSGNYQPITSLLTDHWNTVTVTLPTNAVSPEFAAGVQFATNSGWAGTAFVDAVTY